MRREGFAVMMQRGKFHHGGAKEGKGPRVQVFEGGKRDKRHNNHTQGKKEMKSWTISNKQEGKSWAK